MISETKILSAILVIMPLPEVFLFIGENLCFSKCVYQFSVTVCIYIEKASS